jgi:hypothetical protein
VNPAGQNELTRVAVMASFCVEFRVPLAQVIERIIVFIGARYKHARIHEENGSTYIPPESINLSDVC